MGTKTHLFCDKTKTALHNAAFASGPGPPGLDTSPW